MDSTPSFVCKNAITYPEQTPAAIAANNAFHDIDLIDSASLCIIVYKRRTYTNPQNSLDDMGLPISVENCVRANGVNRHVSEAHLRMLDNQLLNQNILILKLKIDFLQLIWDFVNKQSPYPPPLQHL